MCSPFVMFTPCIIPCRAALEELLACLARSPCLDVLPCLGFGHVISILAFDWSNDRSGERAVCCDWWRGRHTGCCTVEFMSEVRVCVMVGRDMVYLVSIHLRDKLNVFTERVTCPGLL